MGFTGLFFGRIDYQDRELRINNSQCEFIWRASESLGKDAQVFTGLTGEYGGNYGPPKGFEWDVTQSDEPIQDDHDLEDYNVQSRIDDFVAVSMWQFNATRGNHIMMTMGSDFQYESAINWYSNLDKLIHHGNKDGRLNIFYSTPERYVAAKAAEKGSWPLKTDDFFPYADGPHQFWTGYFTSRPNLKRAVRDSSAFFQMAKQLVALGLPEEGFERLEKLAEAMGLVQHHDAVSGTAKQHATFDYSKRLHAGRVHSHGAVFDAVAALSSSKAEDVSFCISRNVSRCEATEKTGNLSVLVWNALAQERTELIELPVSSANVKVRTSDGTVLTTQVVKSLGAYSDSAVATQAAQWTALFEAKLPALGFNTFHVEIAPATSEMSVAEEVTVDDIVLENEFLAVKFCSETGRICSLQNKELGSSIKADQDWLWYLSSPGVDVDGPGNRQASGAYIFRPNKTAADPVFSGKPTLQLVRGELADEVIQSFGDVVSQRVRLPRGARHVEVTYTVTSLPIADGWGKELVFRINTDINNKGACLTDSNGREMQERMRDFRPTWNLNQTESVAGNFFPVNTALAIKDDQAQLTVLTDASLAGTGSIIDGSLELMAHRRLLHDDSRGVGEPLNETEFVMPYQFPRGDCGAHYGSEVVVRGRFFLTLAPPARAAAIWRPLQDRVYLPAAPFFLRGSAEGSYSALKAALPANVQLVTLEPVKAGSVLVRLAHQFGLHEDEDLSKAASVDLATLFADRQIAAIEEQALSGTMAKTDVTGRRVSWLVDGEEPEPVSQQQVAPLSSEITLDALQVRTFLVSFSSSEITV